MQESVLLAQVGDLIRSRRVAAGLTQRALGIRAGISDRYVSEIERGTRDISLSMLHAIVERGLGLELAIAFGNQGSVSTAIPDRIAHIARAFAELPVEARAIAVGLGQGIVDLALVSRRSLR